MIRFLPKGLSIIIPVLAICFFILGILGSVGTFLIIDGYNSGITEIIFGIILIVFAILFSTLFSYWLMYVLRLEINSNSIIFYELKARPRQFYCFEISFVELRKLKIANEIFYNFIYQDGSTRIINLKIFSKKQRVKIQLEILKKACALNSEAVELLDLY